MTQSVLRTPDPCLKRSRTLWTAPKQLKGSAILGPVKIVPEDDARFAQRLRQANWIIFRRAHPCRN